MMQRISVQYFDSVGSFRQASSFTRFCQRTKCLGLNWDQIFYIENCEQSPRYSESATKRKFQLSQIDLCVLLTKKPLFVCFSFHFLFLLREFEEEKKTDGGNSSVPQESISSSEERNNGRDSKG